ncbi:hypothetical protein AV530_002757 [Patagioenas fasciata monilis]|uniref:Uncharacterized protein n=1 Tax=Patagioenas fasciata monilis TaxID=372326 RepID=A0A1V4KRG7_PATFA|nr:hypothetical protein AV530_002757 [Patagioenas fasciata monilis]
MKRSDPHHPQHRHRDGGDSGGAAAEALVSPDGTVTEAPRTVKKIRVLTVWLEGLAPQVMLGLAFLAS